jgi:6-phosphogluconolactonase (cycloisomerase 2 family)
MEGEVGAAFAMTNAPFDNQVVAFSRASSGKLTQVGIYSTGGAGQGVDFDSDGGLQLSPDHKYLYAVSPASDTVTVFSVQGSCLERIQEIYGGDQPVSVTMSWEKKLLYVLDQSVATPGIRGFHIESGGTLAPIGNQTIAISTPIGVPGTVLFTNDASGLIVTNKVGSTIDYYSVDANGEATLITTTASSGNRPFGAWLGNDDTIFIVESGLPVLTNAAISTYQPTTDGALHPITKSEKNQQSDGCWVIVTPDNKHAYTSNFISGTVSSYSVGTDGSVSIIDGTAANQGNGSQPVDLAVSSDGKFLYNLLRGFGAIAALAIESDGSLSSVGTFGQGQGLPPNNGASGLAAY